VRHDVVILSGSLLIDFGVFDFSNLIIIPFTTSCIWYILYTITRVDSRELTSRDGHESGRVAQAVKAFS
jgi:hypothetical protein